MLEAFISLKGMPTLPTWASVSPRAREPEEVSAAKRSSTSRRGENTYAVSGASPARIRAIASSGPETASSGRTGPQISSPTAGSAQSTPAQSVGGRERGAARDRLVRPGDGQQRQDGAEDLLPHHRVVPVHALQDRGRQVPGGGVRLGSAAEDRLVVVDEGAHPLEVRIADHPAVVEAAG